MTVEFGLLISRSQQVYGDGKVSEYVHAKIVSKDSDHSGPRNAVAHEFYNLGLSGHVDEHPKGNFRVLIFEPEYHEPYRVNLREARRQVKVLARCQRHIDKAPVVDGESDLARITRAVGNALKLTFIVETIKHGADYDSGEHRFHSFTQGIKRLDKLAEVAIYEHRQRLPKPTKCRACKGHIDYDTSLANWEQALCEDCAIPVIDHEEGLHDPERYVPKGESLTLGHECPLCPAGDREANATERAS